ncbi:MAG TPA: prolipoprotein diacylglyceryl transferase family protein [Streptosporangiaceae bacterium]
MTLASIPSPGRASWRLGPVPVHAYALCVIAGIIVALVVASRRYQQDSKGIILDVAAWAVPFGLAGAVVHAVLLDGKHDFTAIGGLWHAATVGVALLGVPGAIALGAAGAWIACRRAGVRLGPVAGAAAPAVAFGLAPASLGNWWTQQFYGQPSSWWWAVQISPTRRAPGYENYATFQPLFLYQALWDVAVGFGVIWAARRFTLSGGRTFLLTAAAVAAGSFWTQVARIGPLTRLFGIRYGALEYAAVFAVAVTVLYLTRPKRRPAPRLHPSSDPAVRT